MDEEMLDFVNDRLEHLSEAEKGMAIMAVMDAIAAYGINKFQQKTLILYIGEGWGFRRCYKNGDVAVERRFEDKKSVALMEARINILGESYTSRTEVIPKEPGEDLD